MAADWKNTALWGFIREGTAEDSSLRITLLNCMPTIEPVLADGTTALPNFTLHDHGHGFRVAERAASLLPDSISACLTPIEASLLLLAAYLHDVGMNPRRDIAKRHFQFLITKREELLSQEELSSLQAWLDMEGNGDGIAEAPAGVRQKGLEENEEIFAYYCRHMHNDWSEQWIRDILTDIGPGLYPNWIADLITLCKSHHEGLTELRGERFDARIVGSPASVVNMRYLAALLRVADVLEFDPERTPEVILKHRNISPQNKIYWYKDREISFALEQGGSRMLLTARPPDAPIHHAVLLTASWVDNELSLCSTLQHEGAFRRGTIPEHERERYRWPWPARLTVDIRELDNGYLYIDGAFRPDVRKLLTLLSGTALYGTPLAAIRELVQNAVDAVREQIAYERLHQDNPSEEEWAAAFGKLHKIRLALEKDVDGLWLSCSDGGVGMTKDIIEKHLLVSATNRRPEIRRLERMSAEKGFSVGRTGQFGIGLLSYFMIADKLVISTRHSTEAGGDPENTGWLFRTQGIGGFGELRKETRSSRGTDVRLRLKEEFLTSPHGENFASKVAAYIQRTVLHSPCKIEFHDLTSGNKLLDLPMGWTSTHPQLGDRLSRGLSSSNHDRSKLPTAEQTELYEQEDAYWDSLAKSAAVAN